MGNVLIIGEPLILFTAQDFGALGQVSTFERSIAGAEVNVSIGLTRLGHTVNYVTKLSHDAFGTYIKDYLTHENIMLDYVTYHANKPTGVMFKNKVATGDPSTAYYRLGSAASTLSVDDLSTIDFTRFDLVHVTGIPPALSEEMRETTRFLMQKAKAAGCIITFDPNLRPSLWANEKIMIDVLNELASFADIVLPGMSEGQLLTQLETAEEISSFYLSCGSQAVIIKNGAQGAYAQEQGKSGAYYTGFKVNNIVDTVGAGDGFAVGIISGLLEKLPLKDMLQRANAIGAIQIGHVSDNAALPTQAILNSYIEQQGKGM